MKKISLFVLMIFGIFMLFAADVAPETAQENAVEPETAQAPAENVQEPAETLPETSQEPAENTQEAVETSPETSQEQAQPAENVQEPVETSPETSPEPEQPAESVQPRSEIPQTSEYYRPYEEVGVSLIVLGSLSVGLVMPIMSFMAFTASDACEGTDWGKWFTDLHENSKKHHTAWTVGSVMTGVVGAGMIAVGSWLKSVEKPRENQCVTLEGVAVLPTRDGMYASIGLGF